MRFSGHEGCNRSVKEVMKMDDYLLYGILFLIISLLCLNTYYITIDRTHLIFSAIAVITGLLLVGYSLLQQTQLHIKKIRM